MATPAPPRPVPARVFGLRRTARHAAPVVLPRALGLAGLVTATTLAVLPGSAVAQSAPRVPDVAAQVTQLDQQADLAVERFLQAQDAVAQAQARATAAQQRAAAEQARLDQVRARVADLVSAAFRRGGDAQLASFVADGDPQAYLDRASTLERISRSQADVLAQIATERSRARADRAAADRQLTALRAAQQQLADRRAQVERTLQAQQSLLAGLQEQERQRVEAARAAAAAPVVSAASRSRADAAGPGVPTPTYTGPASGRAAGAVQEAYRQLGKPYQWGSAGPDSFDCSGLTSYVWRVGAGVSLPRTAQQQYDSGRKVAQADVQPGDLVFYGSSPSSIGHEGIYVGDGNMISAPKTGDVVKIQPAFRSDYLGAVRP